MTQPLLVIAGMTGVGKTALALECARALSGESGAELVGADSVQVYRGFDIGSAKPTPSELGEIGHALIDTLDPDEFIDAMDYARLADEAIAEIAARGRLPIVVGGTGLWIRALLRGLVALPKPDPRLRAQLEEEAKERDLHVRLREVDPQSAARIHPHDTLRIVRALEVFEQTGEPLSALQAAHALGAPRYAARSVVIEPSLAELTPALHARVDAMLAAGWVEEVRALLTRWPREARAFGSVGYRQIVAHLLDQVPLEETRAQIAKVTRVYARRQRTWFRGEPGFDLRLSQPALEPVLALLKDSGLLQEKALL